MLGLRLTWRTISMASIGSLYSMSWRFTDDPPPPPPADRFFFFFVGSSWSRSSCSNLSFLLNRTPTNYLTINPGTLCTTRIPEWMSHGTQYQYSTQIYKNNLPSIHLLQMFTITTHPEPFLYRCLFFRQNIRVNFIIINIWKKYNELEEVPDNPKDKYHRNRFFPIIP